MNLFIFATSDVSSLIIGKIFILDGIEIFLGEGEHNGLNKHPKEPIASCPEKKLVLVLEMDERRSHA